MESGKEMDEKLEVTVKSLWKQFHSVVKFFIFI